MNRDVNMDMNTKLILLVTLVLLLIIFTYIIMSNVFHNKYEVCKTRKEK